MVIIGRPINGISLNGNEYILNEDGTLRTWNDRDEAETFLLLHGATYEEIENFYVIEPYTSKTKGGMI